MSRVRFRLVRMLMRGPLDVAFAWYVLHFVGFFVAPEWTMELDEAFPNNLWWVCIPAVAVGLAGMLFWRNTLRIATRATRDNDDAVAYLVAGKVEEAAALFDHVCEVSRWLPIPHAWAAANRGACFLRAGDLASAVDVLQGVVGSGWLEDDPLYRHLAVAYALSGQIDAALSWRERAHARTPAARRAELLLLDVVIALRQGDVAEARRQLDEHLPAANALVSAHQRRQLHLLDAFARAGAGAPPPALAPGREAAPLDLEPLDLAPLTASWPALRAFVGTHEAGGAAPEHDPPS